MVDAHDLRSIRFLTDKYNIEFESSREEDMAIDSIPDIMDECLKPCQPN